MPAAVFRTESWYPIAQTDDGNDWAIGRCWLYCRRERIAVTWIGPACTPNGQRPMFACEDCMAELDSMVRDELRRYDLGRRDQQAEGTRAPVF